MLKIGDFSKLSRVSIRMLRHYDEIGLLKPIWIDPESVLSIVFRKLICETYYTLSRNQDIVTIRQSNFPSQGGFMR